MDNLIYHHLVLVIPGMGARAGEKQVFSRQVPFSEWFDAQYCCTQLQSTMENELKMIQKSSSRFNLPLPQSHYHEHRIGGKNGSSFEIVPIDYSSVIRSEYGVDKLLDMVTPKTGVPLLRQIGNQTCIDVLAYVSSDAIASHVRRVVTREANRIYSQLCDRVCQLVPSDGTRHVIKVSIVAHSLGTVVAYDLLKQMENCTLNVGNQDVATTTTMTGGDGSSPCLSSEQRVEHGSCSAQEQVLNFEVENVFLLGSPLGLFLAMREGVKNISHSDDDDDGGSGGVNASSLIPTANGSTNRLLNNSKVYHLYHPYDPVAYRIEPLMDKRMSDINSVTLAPLDIKRILQQRATDLGVIKTTELTAKWNAFVDDMFVSVQNVQSQLTLLTSGTTPDDDEKKRQMERVLVEFGERVDHVLPAEIVLSEYLVSAEVHLKYWSSSIIAHFLIEKLGFLQSFHPSP